MRCLCVNLLNLILILPLIWSCENEVDRLQFIHDMSPISKVVAHGENMDFNILTNNCCLTACVIEHPINPEHHVQNSCVTNFSGSINAGANDYSINESLVALNIRKTIHVIAGLHSLFDATSRSFLRDINKWSTKGTYVLNKNSQINNPLRLKNTLRDERLIGLFLEINHKV